MASQGDACAMLELRCKKIGKSKMVNVYTWPDGTDSDSQGKRSDIVHTIIQHQRADLLERITKCGWDPNELLIQPKYGDGRDMACRCRNDATSALRECAWNLWSEGVKLCLDAGADSNFNPEHWTHPMNPLELAVYREKPEMVKFLLEAGANPNIPSRDDRSITIVTAIINSVDHQYDTRIVQLLFDHGSGVPAKYAMDHMITGLGYALEAIANRTEDMEDPEEVQGIIPDEVTKVIKGSAGLLELIVKYGPDVTKWNSDDRDDLIYCLIDMQFYDTEMPHRGIFFQEHLDLFYRYGAYTDEADLLFKVYSGTHTNTMRWLIRHGADTTGLKPSMLAKYMYPELGDSIKFERVNEIPFLLVQSGMRLPSELRTLLIELDKLTQNPFSLDEDAAGNLCEEVQRRIKSYTAQYKGEKSKFTKTIPSNEQRRQQMADMEEFSDESLDVYPETPFYFDLNGDPRDMLLDTSSHIVKVLEFLSQPLSLQWWCRHYIRRTLLSLHPFVVKTLPGPARIKRYILCHEL